MGLKLTIAAKWNFLRCTELLLLCITDPFQINAHDDFSAPVYIYCVKHYTAHIESDLQGRFVQFTGTFCELFMLVRVGILLILYFKCAAMLGLLGGPL